MPDNTAALNAAISDPDPVDPKLTGLKGTAGVIAQFGLLTVFSAVFVIAFGAMGWFMFQQFENLRADRREERLIEREDRKAEREIREKEVGVQKELCDGIRRTGIRIEKATDKLDGILERLEKK